MRNLISLEIRKGRNRLILEKVEGGPVLKAINGGASFFYKITVNGGLRCMTPDPEQAQAIWRGCHRWMLTGNFNAAALP